jgi:hypothetical protein
LGRLGATVAVKSDNQRVLNRCGVILKRQTNLRKTAIFIVLIFILIASRLAFDMRSAPYKAAISALYRSQDVKEFAGGKIVGTVLVGLREKYYSSTERGSRKSVKCASRVFFLHGESPGFVEVRMRVDDEPGSEWNVREILLGLSARSSIPCP